MKKRGKHPTYPVYLGPIYPVDRDIGTVYDQIAFVLKKLTSEVYNCKGCGGLLPELTFFFNGKEYRFTCYAIRDDEQKLIAQTDYNKFGEYCRKKEKKE